ncbi:CHAT domain-containing protein [Streptomyces canus]|uniref:CHAT domain-containing protein n=1 Tax=Streptomyces canus TaxID=58343 RepID=UPI00225A4BA9|nr:CHAT domain-containing protein [Streptomyces canus]MCX4859319.1 CHAT domain-containing protein [Streptomyces canus]
MPAPLSVEQALEFFDEAATSGTADELPEQVKRLGSLDLTPDARLFLRIISAQAEAHFGASAKALAHLDTLEEEISRRASGRSAEAEGILTSALNIARGIAYCDQGLGDQAIPCFQFALDIQHSRTDHWRISALYVNLAIAACLAENPQASLSWLTCATEALDRATVPDRWRSNRLASIEINRGGVLTLLGEPEGAIEAYLRARPHLVFGGEQISLGHLDFNLSNIYCQMGSFGSAAESAEFAHRTFSEVGATIHAQRARIAQATALRKMHQMDKAEQLIIDGCLPQSLESLSGTQLTAAVEALDELAHIYRSTRRYEKSVELERASSMLSLRLPNQEIKALSIVVHYIFEAINAETPSQDFRVPGELEQTALEVIRRSPKQAQAPLIADLLERLMHAHASNDYEEQKLTPGEIQALESIGLDALEWQSQVDIAVGTRRRDGRRLLRGHLFDLARFHSLVAKQESPQVRSSMLSSRGGGSLDTVVPLLLSTGDHAGLFELIEWMRYDLGDSRMPSTPRNLVRFGQVLGVSEDATKVYALPPPVALCVYGRSVLQAADPGVDVVAEANEVRKALAGERSAWWTHMFHKGSLIWALLTPDGVYGGAKPLDASARQALQTHIRALPLPLNEDAEILAGEESTWLPSVVAIARAAAGPLVQSQETLDQCIAAVPESVAARLGNAFPSAHDNLDDVYAILGRWMIPDELVNYLRTYAGDARLLVSVQPEVASIPTSLLRTPDGRTLVEQAVLVYAPPVRIAADIVCRPHRPGVTDSHLLIRNPRGDLPDTDLPVQGSRVLSGWGSASGTHEVASRDVVLDALKEESACTQPSALSYLGHIEAGVFGDPASAALLLAPDTPGGVGACLSARDISMAQVKMPDRIYLGGCEGAGFATSLEWSSIGAASLALGSEVVIAHRWPIIDGPHAALVDEECIKIVTDGGDPAAQLGLLQRRLLRRWRERTGSCPSPHFWAGLQVIGRSVPMDESTVV